MTHDGRCPARPKHGTTHAFLNRIIAPLGISFHGKLTQGILFTEKLTHKLSRKVLTYARAAQVAEKWASIQILELSTVRAKPLQNPISKCFKCYLRYVSLIVMEIPTNDWTTTTLHRTAGRVPPSTSPPSRLQTSTKALSVTYVRLLAGTSSLKRDPLGHFFLSFLLLGI